MESTIRIERGDGPMMVYIPGMYPRFNVGDKIAIYEFYSDYEGENVLGEIMKVEYSEECDDWLYTMDNGDEYCEGELYSEQVYKKNK